jgi:PAS domain-containing protein
MEFFRNLFSNQGFIPRAICGDWTPELIRLHNLSDFFIWTAYLAIPAVLVKFAYSKRRELPFRQLFWLFGIFILACGTTHLMDIVLFYNPVYRLSGLVKLITAAASWGTVMALFHVVPHALKMRSPDEMVREIEQRQSAEVQLQSAHDQLGERVAERTAELRASEDRFRLLIEAMPQIVWTARPDGFLDYYNQRWVDYTGLSVGRSVASGWQSVLHPDDLQMWVVVQ